ncbi:BspC domain-containing protein [Paraburkholderia sp. D1E]|uniref:BspC domain-containing protein n=1 Tax=Paraburkholderia sp. D1E TaxID=3461398 RepID=UPI00404640FE
MKLTTVIFLLLTFSWICLRANAQPQVDIPEDYAYLRRMHVPDVVVNCVAAFDRWVRTTPRYDLFVISERRALTAKVLSGKAITSDTAALPIDTVVKTPAFAKVRGKYVWVPVKATCKVWHGHVVGLTAQPTTVR